MGQAVRLRSAQDLLPETPARLLAATVIAKVTSGNDPLVPAITEAPPCDLTALVATDRLHDNEPTETEARKLARLHARSSGTAWKAAWAAILAYRAATLCWPMRIRFGTP